MQPEAVNLFGISLHRVTMRESVALLVQWMNECAGCQYVVTPNVDHVVLLQSDPSMQAAYRDAALVVADGWPLVAASRWLGEPLPERVAGSDLVPGLLAAGDAIPGFGVFLLGAAPGVAEVAARRIQARWPHVRVCGVASPPIGFEREEGETRRIIEAINAASPHLLIVGLGAPKQEIWLGQNAAKLDTRVAIAAGATIDFLAGVQQRAPVWLQRLRLEWLYRVASNPKRLARRYVRDAIVYPRLVFKEWRRIRAESRRPSCGASRA